MDITTQAIPLGQLHESPWNPRKHFPAKPLEELAESIRKVGILSPLLVRPREKGGYEIAAGHRRSRAAKLAKVAEVPAIVRPMGDQEFLEILTIENLQREDVHPLEEGEGYRTLMQQTKWDAPTVAAKIGKSVSYVYQRLKLAELVEPAKKAFLEEKITAGHAIQIARLTPKDQAEVLKNFRLENADQDWYEPMSVRNLAQFIEDQYHLGMVGVPWRKDDAGLLPEAGPCSTCPKRSRNATELFPELAKHDVCTDRACFGKKHQAHREREIAKAEAKGRSLVKLGDWNSRGEGYVKRGDWTEAKADSCPYVKKGIVMSGHDAGRILTFCANQTCKTHHGGSRGSSGGGDDRYAREQRAKQQKCEQETKRRRQILNAVGEQVTFTALTREDLAQIAVAFYEDIWAEYRKQIAQLEGWCTKGSKGGSVWAAAGDAAKKQIPAMDVDGLARLLVTMTFIKHVPVNVYDGGAGAKGKVLEAAAKRWGVDVAKLDALLKAEADKKAKAKPKAKGNGKADAKAAVMKAWKKGAAKAAAKTYPEPTCTECGCTEGAACEGGCSWVKLDRKTNAGLCSACA